MGEKPNKGNKNARRMWAALGALVLVFIIFFAAVRFYTRPSVQRLEIQPNNIYTRSFVVVADADYEPYSFLDDNGQPSGYDVELIYALANRMGFNVDIRLMSWADCKEAITSGEADMIMGLEYREDNSLGVQLSMAMHNDQFICFGREDFSRVEELYGKRLATLEQGGAFVEFLEPYQLPAKTYASYTEALQSVIDGENDYAVVRYSVGRRLLSNLDVGNVRAVGPSIANSAMCIGLSSQSGMPLRELNDGIRGLVSDGSFANMDSKWLGNYVELISLRDFLQVYQTGILIALGVVLLFAAAGVFAIYRGRTRAAIRENAMMSRLLEYRLLMNETTQGLFENIHEINVSQNCAVGEATENYIKNMGLPPNTPFDAALRYNASRLVKPEFVELYLDTLLPEKVLQAYQNGVTRLSCEFMNAREDGSGYYWMRASARLFYWQEDKSVHMILYRQNIDAEKRREQQLLFEARRDTATGLYNKKTTEDKISALLSQPGGKGRMHALVILDVDDFKGINDNFGHSFGDFVIREVAATLRASSRKTDIVGRIGGDEFMMLLCDVPGEEWLREKLVALGRGFARDICVNGQTGRATASIGAALARQGEDDFASLYKKADSALYTAKESGKNGHQIYGRQTAG